MGTWKVEVVRIGKVGKPRSADNLEITSVHGHPVLFQKGEFKEGDLAIYVPIDSVVDTGLDPFSWLRKDAAADGLYRVRLKKIRGVPSYGFLVPRRAVETPDFYPRLLAVGDEVSNQLRIKKYEPDPAYQLSTKTSGDIVRCSIEDLVPLYDIQNLRKWEDLLCEGEHVWITEKLHGTNGKWVYVDGELWCGSRTKFRQNSVWNGVAESYGLLSILGKSENQGLVLYGEIIGEGIQDLTYGFTTPQAYFFDIYDTRTGRWWDFNQFRRWCSLYGLPAVPTLYEGPFSLRRAIQLAEGPSTLLGASHVREGVVVKPENERWDQEIGRVFLKLPGEGYLLRKQKEFTNETILTHELLDGPKPKESTGASWKDRLYDFFSGLFH